MKTMADLRFGKSWRLLRSSDFERVLACRCSAADGLLVIYGAPNDLGHPRLGLTVSQKVGGAVVRNRWKRTLRQAFRLSRDELPPLDLVCIPRPRATPEVAALQISLAELAATIDKKLRRRKTH